MQECSYLSELIEIFQNCEDLEDLANLTTLFHIFKGIGHQLSFYIFTHFIIFFSVMLNETPLLEVLLMDNVFPHVIGALECMCTPLLAFSSQSLP